MADIVGFPPRDADPLRGLSQRQPPANLQAEQALLGAILANNKAFDSVRGFLAPKHFADPILGRIFEAAARRIEAGQLADAVTLRAEFEHSGLLDEVGGVEYLARLLSAMVGIINAGEYGRTIHDAWHRRQLIGLAETLINGAFGGACEARDLQRQTREALETLAETAGVTGDESSAAGDMLDPAGWTSPAPPREWLIDQWVPIGYATGLYGDGAVGKSLLVQMLLTAAATGRPWLGMKVRQGPAFGMLCEDDAKELHRRQEDINAAYAIKPEEIVGLRYWSRFGEDNLLMLFDERNVPHPTELFEELFRRLMKFRPRLVVLDTLSDVFGGKENDRSHARQFVQGVGGRLARALECAVVIPAHPSLSGLQSGKGTSGSTAWNNTFRSRLYLTRPEERELSDHRLLSRLKANYAPADAEITMKWNAGVFVAEARSESGVLSWEHVTQIFDEIEARWHAGDPWSSAPQTRKDGRYLPAWCFQRLGIEEAVAAKYLSAWLTNGYLKVAEFDRRTRSKGLKVIQRLEAPMEAIHEWD